MASSTTTTTTNTVHVTATYTSPTTQPDDAAPHILSSPPLTLPPRGATHQTVADRTTYLRALRAATVALQERINADLTARMAEDVARDAAARAPGKGAAGSGGVGVDDVAEEENYGEEMGADDDDDDDDHHDRV